MILNYLLATRPIIFAGPSGVGKGTIINHLMEKYKDQFAYSVSHTTRKPREGEVDGVDYIFVSREKMEKDIKDGKFIEYNYIHGNIYGTSYEALENVTKSGKICIFDVNLDASLAMKQKNLNPYIIVLLPRNLDVLESRIRGRGQDDENSIKTRLKTAETEIKVINENKDKWDLIIVNDVLEDTLKTIEEHLFGTQEI
ncbi:Guanylate kinase family protein [Trichomonas vaginalis G3]|uniref:guanylate kinase n=1 Tax=Trichomonas vaginalis (strain ATCC PRA-98 / G3) TaxID=412133 RepID=A2F0T4_TRIV3|nr:guanylate kinase protein [Trichomonas vaginalis G3]EAY01469.1 Guanylate kinase family protein [Trichomonas vaginalis G3]KAI5523373.1 guanylate kinase protein [Trichomonas vaginalis G3]|eukprot:XP_001314160.1 Guanylate kinase family protein [Trichomonas vaginalis G3]